MLTKSDFLRFLACPNEFWLNARFPEVEKELTLQDKQIREQGYEVERLARTLSIFKDRDGFAVEFGKQFITENLYAKSDAVVTNLADGVIDIYEVKQAASAKPEHMEDLAFQKHIAELTGFNVGKVFLITVNTKYVLTGAMDVEQLLNVSDHTDQVAAKKDDVAEKIILAWALLETEADPGATLTDLCKAKKLDCRFLRRHFSEIPDYNVSHIFNYGTKKLTSLLTLGIVSINDIPAEFKLTDIESRLVQVARTGEPHINIDEIRKEILAQEYPLHFLDYEGYYPAVPKFENTRPYQQMVFQYSLHTVAAPGEEPGHCFHLSRNDGKHPAEEIAERLYEDLAHRPGTIVVWNESYEKKRNEEMAELFPRYSEFFLDLNERVFDLRKIFSKHHYLHPDFHGGDSIKKVLPVLFPDDPSYKDLGIGVGTDAATLWYHMASGRVKGTEGQKVYDDLCEYCELDTRAMVKIFNFLSVI